MSRGAALEMGLWVLTSESPFLLRWAGGKMKTPLNHQLFLQMWTQDPPLLS